MGCGRLARCCGIICNSPTFVASAGKRTQDLLSIRAVPHVHGAARDLFDNAVEMVSRELASVTDNPAVSATRTDPRSIPKPTRAGGARVGSGRVFDGGGATGDFGASNRQTGQSDG